MHRCKSLALCRIAHGPLSDDGPALSTTGRTGRSGVALQRPRCKTAFFVISFALGSSTLTKEAAFTSCGFFESSSSKVSRCGSRPTGILSHGEVIFGRLLAARKRLVSRRALLEDGSPGLKARRRWHPEMLSVQSRIRSHASPSSVRPVPNVASLDDDKVSRLHVLRALLGACEFPTCSSHYCRVCRISPVEDGDGIVHPLTEIVVVGALATHAVEHLEIRLLHRQPSRFTLRRKNGACFLKVVLETNACSSGCLTINLLYSPLYESCIIAIGRCSYSQRAIRRRHTSLVFGLVASTSSL